MTQPRKRTIRKEVFYKHPPESVWIALTDPRALAEWLMPNNFKPIVGHKFHFQVDPMPGIGGLYECEVIDVDEPHRLVYTWVIVPKNPAAPRPVPMTLTWTLQPHDGGTKLILEQTGVEVLPWWNRFAMDHGWGRMLKTLLPKVLKNVGAEGFTPGAIPLNKRDYKSKTIPEDLTV